MSDPDLTASAELDYDGGLVTVTASAPPVVTQARLQSWVTEAARLLANVVEQQESLAELQAEHAWNSAHLHSALTSTRRLLKLIQQPEGGR